jgi:CheY-like chemotaxis protein
MILSAKQNTTVLVVDDDPVSLEFAVTAFRQHGCRSWSATTDSGAVQLARRYRPDLVVLDMQIGAMDGLLLRDQILISCDPPWQPVFVSLSGETRPAKHKAILKSGFARVLTKPATIAQLLRCLELVNNDQAILNRIVSSQVTSDGSCLQNHAALQALDGDRQLLARFRAAFDCELKEMGPRIDNYLYCRNFRAAAMLVHQLSAAAGYCGAVPLQQSCKSLESALRSGDASFVAGQYLIFLEQCNRLGGRLTETPSSA